MEKDKKLLYTTVLPAIPAAIMVIISIVLFEYSSNFIDSGSPAEGLTILALGGILGIGGILWWWLASDVRTLRWELNQMQKQP